MCLTSVLLCTESFCVRDFWWQPAPLSFNDAPTHPSIQPPNRPPATRVMRPLTCTRTRSHVVWSSPWMEISAAASASSVWQANEWSRLKEEQVKVKFAAAAAAGGARKRRMQNALCGLIKNRPAAAVRRRNAKSCKLTPIHTATQAAWVPVLCV